MELNDEDVRKLDVIINKITSVDYQLFSNDFYDDGILVGNNYSEKKLEFNRLINILSEDGVAYVRRNSCGSSIERNCETKTFKERGGYQKYHFNELEKQQRKESRENLDTELAKSNIEANKLNQANSKFNKTTSIIVIIVGFINLIVFIYQVFIKN